MGYADLVITDKAEIGSTNVVVSNVMENCGIETILSILRFKDEGITPGGHNIDNSLTWEQDVIMREEAKSKCDTIMYLYNGENKDVLSSKHYLTAALETGYWNLYTFVYGNGGWGGWENELISVIAKFDHEDQAKRFLEFTGRYWYFCK